MELGAGHAEMAMARIEGGKFAALHPWSFDSEPITESMTRLMFATPFGVLTSSVTSVIAHLFRTAGLLFDLPRVQC